MTGEIAGHRLQRTGFNVEKHFNRPSANAGSILTQIVSMSDNIFYLMMVVLMPGTVAEARHKNR